MLVEILSVSLKKGVVEIQALDVSEENLSRMERMRVQIMLKRNASSATAERLFHF